MEIKECCVCHSQTVPFFASKNGYVFVVCADCGLIFVNPMPLSENLINDFYSKESGYHANLAKPAASTTRYRKKFISIADELVKFGVKGNILDVGCSNGEFLFLAKQHGFAPYGVEANKHTAGIARASSLNVFEGTLEQARFEDNYFSVIYLGDIIEHVTDPTSLLKECKRILKNNGMLVISTPNTDCPWFKVTKSLCGLFGFPWSVLIPPYHLYLFSESNMKKYLQEMDFSVLKVSYLHASLRHELGGTGLWRQYKTSKSLVVLAYAALVFSAYTIVYGVSFIMAAFTKKDFEMILFSQVKK